MADSTDSETPPEFSRSPLDRPPTSAAASNAALIAVAEKSATVAEYPYIATGEEEGGRPRLRPALEVVLIGDDGARSATTSAMLDTGADLTTFSTEWAKQIGIDVYQDCEITKVRVADKQRSVRYAYSDGLDIEIAGHRLFLPLVMFCEGLPIALLGRRDLFNHFLVLIDQPRFRFFLERLPDPEEDENDDPDLALTAT